MWPVCFWIRLHNEHFHLLPFARFLLDLDIAAPKITIPTDFSPDNQHSTKLMLDLGNLMIRTEVVAEDRFLNI